MANPTLKWPLISGAPKTTGDTPISSDNEGPNPNPNDNNSPTFFIIKHYKWLLQYQQIFQFTWSVDTLSLSGAMPTILLRNVLCTRDLKWEPLTNMTKSGNTYSMELYFAVHPHLPPTRSSRSIWFHTMFSAELGMQSHPRKPTTRPFMGGGNIGDNKQSNFWRESLAKSKTTIGRKYSIYIMQAYVAAFHLK
jgi:hypothetical protein